MKLQNTILTLIFAFVASVSYGQNFEWAKAMGAGQGVIQGYPLGSSITLGPSGNVYTLGISYSTCDFDPSPSVFNLEGGLFISQLDAAGNFVWAKEMMPINTNTDALYPCNIVVDDSSNVYATGTFTGNVDFDPDAGISILTSRYDSTGYYFRDIFITKLGTNGGLLWTKQMGGDTDGYLTQGNLSLALDNLGNVYISGFFSGTIDFDPGIDTFKLTSFGNSTLLTDIFVVKLTANGDFVWAKRMGGTSYENVYGIATDDLGNVYMTGSFSETADFDPSVGTFNLTAQGTYDAFTVKLDTNGELVWAKSIGGVNGNAFPMSLTLDSLGYIYNIGYFNGSVDFDPNTLNTPYYMSSGSDATYVTKSDSMGNFIWVKSLIGSSGSIYPYSMALDDTTGLYITGYFDGTVDFDPGVGIYDLTPVGISNIFVAKLTKFGDFSWAKQVEGLNTYDQGLGIVADAWGNVYSTGQFSATCDFDPSANTYSLTGITSTSAYIQKLNHCAAFNTTVTQNGASLTANETNVSYQWIDCSNNTSIIGANSQAFTPITNGNYAVILSKEGCTATSTCYAISNVSISESTLIQKIKAYPNPTSGTFTIDLGNEYAATKVEIFSLVGQLLDTENYTHLQLLQIEMPIIAGVYFVQVRFPNGESATIKMIKE